MGSRPSCAIPKAVKMVLVAPLLTLATNGSTRKIQESRWVFVACYVTVKALQSLCCLFQNATLNKASLSFIFIFFNHLFSRIRVKGADQTELLHRPICTFVVCPT